LKRRITSFLAVGIVLGLGALSLFRQTPSTAQPAVKPRPEIANRQLVGTTSCSASVCHGGADLGKPGSEATTWHALDPHGRAFDSLLTARSKAMAKHLWGDATPAHEAALCLKCHVHPSYDQARPNFRRADGVGCESCHGAAQDWVGPHYRAAWQSADKAGHGLADTKSLAGRAIVCVRCHVGTRDANVDHDLIAAGHPALRFEFSAFFANLPPHWDVAKDRKRIEGKDFEVHAWLVGQHTSAATAAELLAFRADPTNGKTWPEFAEMDCFSCHHDLQGRSSRNATAQKPGALRWSNWYFTMTDALTIGRIPPPDRTKSRGEITTQALRFAEHQRSAAQVKDGHALVVPRLQKLADQLNNDQLDLGYSEYNAQLYLALQAANLERRNHKLNARFRDGLSFPPGYNSPHRPEVNGQKK
jgi:cytochrome c554/c'-like protein